MESKYGQDKLAQYNVGGATKPFIDQNLQIHVPDLDSNSKPNPSSHSPIYSHYVGSSTPSHFSSPVNEADIDQAIRDAERSYEAWKKMEKKLRETARSFQKTST